MKKLFALIISCIIIINLAACSAPTETADTEATGEILTEAEEKDINAEITSKIESIDFEGIVYLTHNGTAVYSLASGEDENGTALNMDSPMYIGSVSKQFCAAAILMLSEQGKLSITDTLDKYFPEYQYGGKITIENLLCMRSGIHEMTNGGEDYFNTDKTESENISAMKEWLFSLPLDSEPDTKYEYNNTNFFLLGIIVEQITGVQYEEFIRNNIFEPLEMTSSGFVSEVGTKPDFSGLSYDSFYHNENAPGMLKGFSDIVSTAYDMDKWMTALKSGEVVSTENFEQMCADHSPDFAKKYGYGIEGMYKGSGHGGLIGDYRALDYFETEYGYNLFAAGSGVDYRIETLPQLIMPLLIG